jgi:CheY-like chemotaxis protein
MKNARMTTIPPPPIRILLVEDSPDDAHLIETQFRRAKMAFAIARVKTEGDFRAQLSRAFPDIILCDFHLPRLSCFRVFDILQTHGRPIPVVVVSHFLTDLETQEVMAAGASRYVCKSDFAALPPAIRSSLASDRNASPLIGRPK